MKARRSRRSFLASALRGATGLVLAPHLGIPPMLWGALTAELVVRAFHTMGSTLRIAVLAESRTDGIEAISDAFTEFDRLDRLLSVYRDDSTVSRINRAAGRGAVRVEDDVLEVIGHGRAFARRLDGAFDTTLGPLMRAWGFRGDDALHPSVPSERDLLRMLESVGADQIVLDPRLQTVGLRSPGCTLDLGGIGVGFAIDRVVALLRHRGIDNAFINHSGDAYALGRPPDLEGWPVGIPDPRDPQTLALAFSISDRAVSSSGSYRNFRRQGDRIYGHLLNPRTGHPAEAHLAVTVIARSSLEADVLSTAAFCSDDAGGPNAVAGSCQGEVIRLDRSPSGHLVCSQYVQPGSPRTPLHSLDG